MALPSLTPAEKKKALEKAQTMRRARAELRAKLKKGEIKFADILSGKDDAVIQRMKVSYLLKSLPRVGKVKAEKIMEEVGIDESRRVQGLGKRQKEALLARFLEK
ncbi:MAG: integration host factor, actinobacterial type [Bacillota bacterium]|jgi:DNA uptake protein ComE-like DNA-binding protein|nr:integration host factor [Candidatus Fermentithermobacillaceae bacterium]